MLHAKEPLLHGRDNFSHSKKFYFEIKAVEEASSQINFVSLS